MILRAYWNTFEPFCTLSGIHARSRDNASSPAGAFVAAGGAAAAGTFASAVRHPADIAAPAIITSSIVFNRLVIVSLSYSAPGRSNHGTTMRRFRPIPFRHPGLALAHRKRVIYAQGSGKMDKFAIAMGEDEGRQEGIVKKAAAGSLTLTAHDGSDTDVKIAGATVLVDGKPGAAASIPAGSHAFVLAPRKQVIEIPPTQAK